MKANNLTICIPAPCNKKCPYCISRMTWSPKASESIMRFIVPKVKTLAKITNVTSVLLTSKGEPTENESFLLWMINQFKEWPLELQTNGEKIDAFLDLDGSGYLDIIALSVDKLTNEVKEYCKAIFYSGTALRLCFNITDMLVATLDDLLSFAKEYSASQVLIRKITVPKPFENDWIKRYCDPKQYENMKYDAQNRWGVIRTTVFGSRVYNADGIALTFSDECIQQQAHEDEIRSLILNQDGHVYTTWDSPASILF